MRAVVRICLLIALWRAISLLFDLLLIPPLASAVRLVVPQPLLWLERALHFLLYLAAVVLALVLAARWLDRRHVAAYALAPTRKQVGDLLAGTLLGLALMATIFAVLWAMGWLQIEEAFFVNLPGVPFAVAIWGPVLAFVVIALAEELLFRGYILRNSAEGVHGGARGLGDGEAVLVAWLVSSALFGLFHIFNPATTWASTLNLTLAGLMLGLPVILTGRLGFAVGLHFAWNFAQGTLFGLPVSGNEFEGVALLRTQLTGPVLWTGGLFGPEAGLLGLATLLAGSVIIVLWAMWREGGLAIAQELARYQPIHPLHSPAPDETSHGRPS